jgi:hypothetical protein
MRPLRTYAYIAVAVLLAGILENALFGKDHPGTAHDIGVVFFLASVLALVALLVLGVVALLRRARTS